MTAQSRFCDRRTHARARPNASAGTSSSETIARVHRRDLHRDVVRQRLKSGVRATKSVSQLSSTSDADAAAGVDVGLDHALRAARPDFLSALARPCCLQQIGRLLDVAVGFLERALALHDAGAGLLAQFLYLMLR